MPYFVILAAILIIGTLLFFLINRNKGSFVRRKPKQNDASGPFKLSEDLDELKKKAKDVSYREEE